MSPRRPRGTLLVAMAGAGVGLVLVALVPDWVGLGRPGLGRGQVALLGLAALAILGAGFLRVAPTSRLRPAVRRLGSGYRVLASALLTTVLLLSAVEAVGRWVIDNPRFAPSLNREGRARLPYYRDQPWTDRHWREFRLAERTRYSPYSLWRTAPFSGETLVVDARGLRRTPGSSAAADALRVLCFGGSAMWGYGSPDEHTIPAHLQRRLGQRLARPVAVENRGERGFVLTQSLIELVRGLQQGNVPDVVIFYDGFNDVAVGHLTGQPGLHLEDGRIRTLLERPFSGWVARWWSVRRLARVLPGAGGEGPGRTPAETRDLARAITDVYLNSHKIGTALARRFGFEAYFFLQPVMAVGHKPLTPEEEALGVGSPPLVELLRLVYPAVERAAAAEENLYYLGGLLDGETDQIYIDEVHITPQGNELVARAMGEVVVAGAAARP